MYCEEFNEANDEHHGCILDINDELNVMVSKVKDIELAYLSENAESFVGEIDEFIFIKFKIKNDKRLT